MRTDSEHEEARWLPHLLAGVAGLCGRRPWHVICLTLLSCGLSLYANFAHLEYQTQRNDLLSPNLDVYKHWQKFVNEFGDDDDMIVVVRGKDRATMESALEALATEIKHQPEHFDRLFYKSDLRSLQDRKLLFLPHEQIREIQHDIKKMSRLLEPPLSMDWMGLSGWIGLSLSQLLTQAEARINGLKNGVPLSHDDIQFFQQLEAICKTATNTLRDSDSYHNPWLNMLPTASHQEDLLATPQYFFPGNGSLAILLVRPVKEKDSFTAAKKSVDAMRTIIDTVRPQFSNLEFGLTGLPVLENDEMVATTNDSNTASWLALAGVALLYLVAYRGLRYPLMTVATLLVGTAWALGWTVLTVGHLNILSSAFAVMLIGMGDYGVLWVTRFGQERKAGADFDTAMSTTALSVGSGILTAAMTTALAFFATMLADFKAITELGWIAGCGVLFCAISCFTVMPALLKIFDFRFEREAGKDAPILPLAEARQERALWLPHLAARPRLVIGVSLAVTALLGFFAFQVRYDHNLLNLQAQELESVKWEHILIEHTGGANWYALSWTDSAEEALALKAKFEKLSCVSRVVEVATLVPPGQDRKLPMLADINKRLQKLPERGKVVPHMAPNIASLQEVLERLTSARGVPPLSPEGEKGMKAVRDSFAALNQELANQTPAQAAATLRHFDEKLARDLADDLHRLRDVSHPVPLTVADLPPSLRERYLGKSGKWLLQIFGKDCLWDYEPLARFVTQIRTVDANAAGKPFTTLEGLRGMRSSFLWAGVYALIAMVVILLLDFRNWKHTLVALAPIFMGLVCSLGVMALCGVPLNPANMIAFPLILGVGADNGVHVIHDYRSRGNGHRYLLGYATGRGIMVAALTTVLGFVMLMISTHRGMSGLGLILTLGVSCCMVTALVVLPALLHLQSIRRQKAEAAAEPRAAA
jgi:hopanoid biosynthesis associated RND transporter like protein HpnN